AAAMPGCWFGRDYHDGYNLRIPEVQRLREGAAVLVLAARVKAAAGDTRGALADVALVLRIARHINEPMLIAFIVAPGVEENGTRALEEVLARTTPKAEDLAPLAAEEAGDFREDLLRCMRMEEAAASAFFASLSDPATTKWLEEDPHVGGLWAFRSSFYRVF